MELITVHFGLYYSYVQRSKFSLYQLMILIWVGGTTCAFVGVVKDAD